MQCRMTEVIQWRATHTWHLSFWWHQHHFQLTPKNTLIPNFYTKTHQFTIFWHQANFFWHLKRMWCMWQISKLYISYYPGETKEVFCESSVAGRSMFGEVWFETDTPADWNKKIKKVGWFSSKVLFWDWFHNHHLQVIYFDEVSDKHVDGNDCSLIWNKQKATLPPAPYLWPWKKSAFQMWLHL